MIAFAIVFCIFLTFYFSLLSHQTFDETLKAQFLIFSTIFLIIGVILFFCLIFYHAIGKAISNHKLRLIKGKIAHAIRITAETP